MYQTADLPVTSIKSLTSTIATDKQVRRWFMQLILLKTVKKELSGNKDIEAVYKKLGRTFFIEKIIGALSIYILLLVVTTRIWEYGFEVCVLLGINALLQAAKKRLLVKLCVSLITRDFDRFSLAQKTLYQIGELYSREYNIVPLVDEIIMTEAMTRKAVLYVFVFTTIIYPLNFWQIYGSVIAVYYIFYGIIDICQYYYDICPTILRT